MSHLLCTIGALNYHDSFLRLSNQMERIYFHSIVPFCWLSQMWYFFITSLSVLLIIPSLVSAQVGESFNWWLFSATGKVLGKNWGNQNAVLPSAMAHIGSNYLTDKTMSAVFEKRWKKGEEKKPYWNINCYMKNQDTWLLIFIFIF